MAKSEKKTYYEEHLEDIEDIRAMQQDRQDLVQNLIKTLKELSLNGQGREDRPHTPEDHESVKT